MRRKYKIAISAVTLFPVAYAAFEAALFVMLGAPMGDWSDNRVVATVAYGLGVWFVNGWMWCE